MKKILVIEDEPDIREIIVDVLEFKNYVVKSAQNGAEGISQAKSFMPDLIVSDIMMPEVDGYGVLLELSQDPDTASIPFIFLTAKVTQEDVRKGMVLGADDYLAKPFRSQELLDAVEARLKKHERLTGKYDIAELRHIRDYINLSLPHELRTPLTGIVGSLYLLEDLLGGTDDPLIKRVLKSLSHGTGRLGQLIENYVAYAQIRLLTHEPEVVAKLQEVSRLDNVDHIIREMVETEAAGHDRLDNLNLDLQPGVVLIFLDHFQKMLLVLVENAIKFSNPDTPICVSGRPLDDQYIIEITNIGRGFSAEQINNIGVNVQFERHYYEQQGVGLGLVIAQMIAKLYQGEFIITSTQGDKTTVSIKLPLAAEV